MKNRDLYAKDPSTNKILNDGWANVSDALTEDERRTLRWELDNFQCDGEYARGLERILRTYLDNVYQPQQPGVWISGWYGSGKSHLVKVLRALWVDYRFPEDNATARGLVKLPTGISDLLTELANRGKREGGLHAASGTLGSGAGDYVRMALLGIVFRSVGLAEQYPLACFEMWLRDQGFHGAVKSAVESAGKEWRQELRRLYVSPVIVKALLDVYPDFAESTTEARKLLKEQYPNIHDVTNQQMVDAIRDALSREEKFPLTLVALDEIQQYIGDNQARSMAIQEVTETCCKSLGGKLLFVGTGQTAMAGTPMLGRLKGRFPVSIELSDTDVQTVIRKVILAKKPDRRAAIEKTMTSNLGEISRHLSGTKIEHHSDDVDDLAPDYPILPVRRRFWERILRAVDQAGTAGQLRNQLKVVHEATQVTAEESLGTVVAGDFIFDQIAPNLLQTGVLSREIYEYIKGLAAGDDKDQLKARLCGLIYLIGKLPRNAGADLGVRATPDALADLLVQNLQAGSGALRKNIPALLKELEDAGRLMRVGDEFRLQTRESSAWNDEYRAQQAKILSNPHRVAQERADLLRQECTERLKGIRLVQGDSKESRSVSLHFGAEAPGEPEGGLHVWVRDGWEEEEATILADARAAGTDSATIFVFLPRRSADELKNTLASLRGATATLEVRGVPSTTEGEEARLAMQTREADRQRRLTELLDEVFGATRVFQGGGQEVNGTSLAEAVKKAAENSLVRLFPQFDVADHTGWSKVITRAKGGSEDALEAVGHKGDPDKQPVTSAVLKYVAVGKKGSDIRKHFSDPPYGWPRDAIDGALYLLLLTGHLRATDTNQKPVDAQSLDRSKITRTQFRLESTTVTAPQRIQIRKLLQDAGIPCTAGEELQAIPRFLQHLEELADAAGGKAPCPERPDTSDLKELSGISGNEQLLAVHTQRESLAECVTEWIKTREAIAERLPRWRELEALLEEAADLPETTQIQEQADAVIEGRMLLEDPDPVPPLRDKLTQLLRDALVKAQREYRDAHDAGMHLLEKDENWTQLSEEQCHDHLAEEKLTVVPEISTGTTQEVLTTLRGMPLGTWADRCAALPGRFDRVRLRAAELMEPQAVYVKIPGRTLKDADDVKAWLSELEKLLLDKLEEGEGPVVIG